MVMVLFLEVPKSASSSNNNTGVVIGVVVSAVVVLVIVVLIVAWFLYRRMPKRENARDIIAGNIQNAAYRDTQLDGSQEENSRPSSFMGGPVDASYQSLKTEDLIGPVDASYQSLKTEVQMQPGRSHNNYENVQRNALLNMRNNPGNDVLEENLYEVMQ
jgi:hypothetical protein